MFSWIHSWSESAAVYDLINHLHVMLSTWIPTSGCLLHVVIPCFSLNTLHHKTLRSLYGCVTASSVGLWLPNGLNRTECNNGGSAGTSCSIRTLATNCLNEKRGFNRVWVVSASSPAQIDQHDDGRQISDEKKNKLKFFCICRKCARETLVDVGMKNHTHHLAKKIFLYRIKLLRCLQDL